MTYVGGESPPRSDCFICAAIAGTKPDADLVVAREDRIITMLNRFPYSPGHLLIAPTQHAGDPRDLSVDDGAAMFRATQQAMRALDASSHPDGFNLGFNVGAAAGASIEHLHLHVVPRWSGDTNFMPVLGDVKVLPEHLEATAQRLRDAFDQLAR
jgi:ATP adenylyltransferase